MTTAVDVRNQEKDLAKKEQAKSAWVLLEKMKPSIAAVLPHHMTPERMAMIAFTAMRRNPKLMECSQESVVGSIMTAAMLGLEPSGPLGHGALIPYWNNKLRGYECQFQPMYQGLLDLARRSGFIKDVQLRAVFKGDKYSYRFGLDPSIEHVPLEGAGADDPDREPTHVYAIIRLASGGIQWDQMSFAQAVAHGKRYSPSYDPQTKKFKPGSVWADNPLAMCLKTILKIVLKLCPKSPELSAALQMDDLADVGKTSTMRKMGEDVFDVDFGEEPEESDRGKVNVEDLKAGTEENRGHGNENLAGAVRPQESGKSPEEAHASQQTQKAADLEATCTETHFNQIEIAAKGAKLQMGTVHTFVKGTLGYKLYSQLKQRDLERVTAFIANGGKE